MLKAFPVPPAEELTEGARSFAYPQLTPAAQAAIAAAEPRAAALELTPEAQMAAARERTGLSDFGTAPLVEPQGGG